MGCIVFDLRKSWYLPNKCFGHSSERIELFRLLDVRDKVGYLLLGHAGVFWMRFVSSMTLQVEDL